MAAIVPSLRGGGLNCLVQWLSGQDAGVERGPAQILDPLIKQARQVGVRPIPARTAPSKHRIPAAYEPPPQPPPPPPTGALNRDSRKSLTHIILLFMASEKRSFRVDGF